MAFFDTPVKRTARTAGFLYLIVVVTGIFSLAYIPARITLNGTAGQVVGSLTDLETLYRVGIMAGVLCYTAFLVLPLVLHKLLSPYGKQAAILMVAFAVVSVPISFVNIFHQFEVLSLLSGAEYLTAFSTDQRHAQVMLALDEYRKGLLLNKIFWGLWLFPFGYLVLKSGMLPKVLGILLMIGCAGYLVDFAGTVMFPGYKESVLAAYVTMPAALGEIGTCLWLLLMGAREK
jgi:hypothetical protein